jgi:hypothetical protein
MNSRGKVVDLAERLKDRVVLCCLENLATTGLKADTIINVPVLTVDIAAERDGK